jgi:hypothetical protein
VRELRRITRGGGQVIVVLNGEDHLRELRDAVTAALPPAAPGTRAFPPERVRLDDGARLLATEFRSVTRHDFVAELLVPGPDPVENYVRSMIATAQLPDPDTFIEAVIRNLRLGLPGNIRIRTHCGCLIAT